MSINHDEMAMSASAPDPFPSVSQKRRRGVRVTTAAAVALGLAISGGAVANAATSSSPSSSTATGTAPAAGGPPNGAGTGRPPFGGTPPAAVGTVKSVGSGSFTLTTPSGTTVTVDVDSSTSYLDPEKSSPSVADVTVGAHVAVFGTDTANTVTATKVAIGGPPNGAGTGRPPFGGTPPAAVGTVKSVGSGSFTLTTPSGTTVTVDVDSSTSYLDPEKSSPSVADVTVGAHVAVFGTDTANTVTATKVAIGGPPNGAGTGRPPFGGTPPAAVGTVKSVGSGSFTLTTPSGTTVTVDVDSSTSYLDPEKSSPSVADVTVGAHVAVFGTDTANTVTATKVAIGGPPNGAAGPPNGAPGPGGFGGPGPWSGSTTGGSASGRTSSSSSGSSTS